MGSVAVVYWSSTDATEKVARLIARGAANAGASVSIYSAEEFKPSMVERFGAVALGCPAMELDKLEHSGFAKLMADVDAACKGRAVAVFGPYGLGADRWIEDWEHRMEADGAAMASALKVSGEPTDAATERCMALGARLARAAKSAEAEYSVAV